jgi:RNA polymerase sigma factor for flagellar operon FliA
MDKFETQLVTENIKLAQFLARKTWEKAPSALDLEELISLAYQGLVGAAIRYRAYGEEHNYSEESIATAQYFSVFARRRILGNIYDQLRSSDHVPRGYRRDYKALVEAGYSAGSTVEELSSITGLGQDRIKKTLRLVENTPISIDEEVSDGNTYAEVSLEADHNVESSALVSHIMQHGLVDVVDAMTTVQKIVVVLKYYEGLELKQIADELGYGLQIVRDAHTSALIIIRAQMLHRVKEAS